MKGEVYPLVFIGYDERQHKAYEVCIKSIVDRSEGPVLIYPLDHRDLRKKGLFKREWVIDAESGRLMDKLDGQFFSNTFSQTRFLTPFYADWLGFQGWPCLFVDCDFVFVDDIYKLFKEANEEHSFISCVHHEYKPTHTTKMDGQQQTSYPKKLWSSLMHFNPRFGVHNLTVDAVNNQSSSWLHRMEWINDEEDIGRINERWNFIPNHSETRVRGPIGAIHYTEGLPTMPGYETSRLSGAFTKVETSLQQGRN